MAKNMEERIKSEVKIYNALNKEKSELENKLGKINQEMLKIIGKLELLNDLNKKKEDEDA